MKNLKVLLQSNPDLLVQGRVSRTRDTRHLIFSGSDLNLITMPLCGASTGVNKRKTKGVTCETCKAIAEVLNNAQSYQEALTLITPYVPNCITPMQDIMELRHGDQPTKLASQHLEAQQFLANHAAKTPADLPLRILGTEAQYAWNMLELDLIDEEGEPLVPVWE